MDFRAQFKKWTPLLAVVLFGVLTFLFARFFLNSLGGPRAMNETFPLLSNGGGRFVSTLLLAIFFSLFLPSKLTFWLFVFPCSVFCALYAPFARVYGFPDYQSLISVLATNQEEAFEFLSQIPFKVYLKGVLVPILGLGAFFLANKFSIKPWRNKVYMLASLLVFVICAEPSVFVRKTITAAYQTHKTISELKISSAKNSWPKGEPVKDNKDYILVIGESARKDYFHLYGYPVANTPFLDSVNSITVDGLKAGGTYTIGSLTNMLTTGNKEKWEPKFDYSLLDLANKSGIETYWISNQGLAGKWDSPVSVIGFKAKTTKFLHSGEYDSKNLSDYLLIRQLRHIVYSKTKGARLIIVHTLGSHPDACRRVEDVEDKYEVTRKDLDYVACYVTSIKKADAFLEQVYSMMKKSSAKTGRPFSIIYFSDHGQIHRNINGQTIINNNSASKFHYDIPLIRIDSDAKTRVKLTSQKSGLNFTEGLAHWMGIQNPKLQNYDLFDGKDDPSDYGLSKKIEAIKNPADPAIDISPYLKTKKP